jgi:hypothetical protein
MARLGADVSGTLAAGDLAGLRGRLEEFASRYPRVSGIDGLQHDLAALTPVQEALAAGRPFEASAALAAAALLTPPFRQRAETLRRDALPSAEVVEQHRQAKVAWREGDFARAAGLLEAIPAGPWQPAVAAEIERMARVRAEFQALDSARGTPGYQGRLLAFYGALDPATDAYFAQAVAGEFQEGKKEALAAAAQSLQQAQKAWDAYQADGGIRGLHRLEARVSDTFRKQAAHLGDAYRALSHGLQVYRLLNLEYPAQWQGLRQAVEGEVALQRRSLTELGMVLEPSLLQVKLQLLPEPRAEAPTAVAGPGTGR